MRLILGFLCFKSKAIHIPITADRLLRIPRVFVADFSKCNGTGAEVEKNSDMLIPLKPVQGILGLVDKSILS